MNHLVKEIFTEDELGKMRQLVRKERVECDDAIESSHDIEYKELIIDEKNIVEDIHKKLGD